MRNTFTYYTYEKLSGNTVDPALALYNNALKDPTSPRLKPELIHSLASVSLAMAGQPRLAAAEGALALEAANDDYGRYVAYSALSVAFYSNSLKGMGEEYAAKARLINDGMTHKEHDQKFQDSRITAKVVLGVNAIAQGDGPAAESLFSELGALSGNEWLGIAAHGAAIMADGPGFSTLSKLKSLANSPMITFEQKQKLAELEVIAANSENAPTKMKNQTDELVKQWTFDSLKAMGKVAKDTVIEATLQILKALFHLIARA
ncbi:MAG: hypothetical protein HRT35_11895 [Algicola sp.]|nr:hypothetical protein [Algicola sp.]